MNVLAVNKCLDFIKVKSLHTLLPSSNNTRLTSQTTT